MKSSSTLDKLYTKKLRHPPEHETQTVYKQYRNIFNSVKRKARQNHFANQLNNYRNDIKKTWEILRPLFGKATDKTSLPSSIKIQDKTITDPENISNEFCKYFTKIGRHIQTNISNGNSHSTDYLVNRVTGSLYLSPTCESEIVDIINSLKPKKGR